jgi:hypothetical protein
VPARGGPPGASRGAPAWTRAPAASFAAASPPWLRPGGRGLSRGSREPTGLEEDEKRPFDLDQQNEIAKVRFRASESETKTWCYRQISPQSMAQLSPNHVAIKLVQKYDLLQNIVKVSFLHVPDFG